MCVTDGMIRGNAMLRDVLVDGKDTPVLSGSSERLQEEYWGFFVMLQHLVRAFADYCQVEHAEILDILLPKEGSCTCGSSSPE